MNFVQRGLCEADGSPSSTRINLLLLLLFTMALIAWAAYMAGKLPEVPPSLADLIKFLFGAATAKVALGSAADLVAALKSPIPAGDRNGNA